MPEATLTAPSAPAVQSPAPKVQQTPPKAPTPEPKSAPEARKAPVNEFDDIDARLNPKPKEPAKPAEPADDDEEDEAQESAPAASEKADPKPKDQRTIETPKGLRTKFEQTLKELKQVRETMAEREAKVAELEGRSKETTTLAERLAAVEKERDAIKAEVMGLKQEVTPEFTEKYVKPFETAADSAKRFFTQLTIDNGDGTTRPASWEQDFAALYVLPEVKAWKQAQELFGDMAPRVMARYEKLHELKETEQTAREQERVKWQKTQTEREANAIKERETNEARTAQDRERSRIHFKQTEEKLKTDFPDWFGEDPADAEGTELVKSMTEKMLQPPKSLEEHIAKQVRIKLSTENFPRVIHKLNKANERIAELQAKLSSKNGSEPGGTTRKGKQEASSEGDWDSDLKSLRNAR